MVQSSSGLDAVLVPGYAAYRPAPPDEQYCYRRGHLVITSRELPRLRRSGAPPARDATGEQDLGHIDALMPVAAARETWRLKGDWGELDVVAPTVRFVLSEA